jgi:hypothetical protein
MRVPKLVQNGFYSLSNSQNTLIKQIHNGPKHAKKDLKPFLAILGTAMRAKAWKRPTTN